MMATRGVRMRRIDCPICGAPVAIRPNRRVYRHVEFDGFEICEGSGQICGSWVTAP